MSPKSRRVLFDFLLAIALTLPLFNLAWWAGWLAIVFGLWNYYDGKTRSSLSEERP